MNKTKTVIFSVLGLAVGVGLVLLVLETTGTTNLFGSETEQPATQATENEEPTINLDPPTEQEQMVGDQIKQEIAIEEDQRAEAEQGPPTGADVVLVDASQYSDEIEVRAFVSNVIEDGVCTITFTQGSASFSEEVPAYADASTTPCIALTVPRSEFSATGVWQVEVAYASANIRGSTIGSLEVK